MCDAAYEMNGFVEYTILQNKSFEKYEAVSIRQFRVYYSDKKHVETARET